MTLFMRKIYIENNYLEITKIIKKLYMLNDDKMILIL